MRLSLFLMSLLLATPAMATAGPALTLLDAYDNALYHDPTFQAATFDFQASQQEEAIGLAPLLPQLNASGRYGSTRQLSGRDLDGSNEDPRFTSTGLSLSARQVLYDRARAAYYAQAKARGELGESLYDDAFQELFPRVVETYFEVARQENELSLSRQQKIAIEGLVKQTRRLFEVGDGTITDIDEAQARLDLVKAQEIEAEARLQAALHALSGRTGVRVASIQAMGENLPGAVPLRSEEDLAFWRQQAQSAAPRMDARRDSVRVAEAELRAQKAGHYPQLALVGELSHSDRDDLADDFRRQSSSYVGLSLDVPLYAGGGVNAASRKSQYALSSAQAQLDDEARQLSEDIERNYLGVVSGYAKCKALQTAVRSNQRALESAEKGYQAGVRSTVDILNAQQTLFMARRDLLNSKLLMLQSLVELHARSGLMNRAVLQQVEALF
ncbi:outer membrane protein, protease secretion system [Aquipseudomonas alcaligenes]|uniref:Outer membrane protein, protease secretion system n=1 Tax=Aquipseudomonas alcaligenes TaxID=43263 RepID=A0A1N7H007_AQUAC|nr:TolC family outer membrane protein [Pseudomonas alcaligenes]SIP97252.1 outer membrane protein, protease secretion system [Pseudomonas alcaligenes]SIS18179.1 outer membrane protein, protease secretion system [Pseudomonas alcaligenes]